MARKPIVRQTLDNEGFTTQMEISDEKVGKVFSVSAGIIQENAAKSDIALRAMQKVLVDAGYTNVFKGEDIAANWKDFQKKDTNAYIRARENILQDTKLVSDVSKRNRLTTAGLYNLTG